MKVVLGVIVGLGLCGLAACSAESSTPEPAPSEASGPANVKSEERGDTVESTVSSDKTDDHLKITFDKKNRAARIAPKFGQAKTVAMEDVPANAAAASRMLSQALDTAAAASRRDAKGVKTQSIDPPSTGCANDCAAACDEAYPQACLNAACKFGCGVCCASN
jgi:hypothetical protein